MSSTWDSNLNDWVDTTWESTADIGKVLEDDEYEDEDYE